MKFRPVQARGKRKFKTMVMRLAEDASPAGFKLRLRERFFLRLHMLLILAGVVLAGVGTSKLLLALGVTALAVRYPLGVLVGYAFFFLLARVWLWYVGVLTRRVGRRDAGGKNDGDWSGFDFSSGEAGGGTDWSGFGGGSSGGGGASDSWGEGAGSVADGWADGAVGDGWLDFGFDLDGMKVVWWCC